MNDMIFQKYWVSVNLVGSTSTDGFWAKLCSVFGQNQRTHLFTCISMYKTGPRVLLENLKIKYFQFICRGPYYCQLDFEIMAVITLLLVTLAQSLCVSLPARLSVQLSRFQPIRGLQDAPTDDDDIRALVAEDFFRSSVLLAKPISC